MDIRLLNAIKDYLQGKSQQIFMDRAFKVLQKNGLGGGFRKSTWWNNPNCKQMLCQILSTTPGLLGFMTVETPALKLWFNDKETLDYFKDKWSAPQDKEDLKDDEDPYRDWLIQNCSNPEFLKDFKEKIPQFGVNFFVNRTFTNEPEINYEEFCRKYAEFCDEFEPLIVPNERFLKFFPRPAEPTTGSESSEAQTAAPSAEATSGEDVESHPDASAENSPDNNARSSAAVAGVNAPIETIVSPELNDAAKHFRSAKDINECVAIVFALVHIGFDAAACDYSLQSTYLSQDDESDEATRYMYLKTLACAYGQNEELAANIEAYKEDFPNSSMLGKLDDDIRTCVDSHNNTKCRLPIWKANRFDYGLGYAEQDKALKRESNDWMSRNKLIALEFLHGALALMPDNVVLLRNLAQTQSSLGLSAPASFSFARLAKADSNHKSATDALQNCIASMLSDGRVKDAWAKLKSDEMHRYFASDIERMTALVHKYLIEHPEAEPDEDESKEEPTAPETAVDATETAVNASDTAVSASETTVSDAAVAQTEPLANAPVKPLQMKRNGATYYAGVFTYPMKLMGYVQWRNNFVNFHPNHIEDHGKWVELIHEDTLRLFPKLGLLNLHFPLGDGQSKLKDAHPFIIEIDYKTDVRKSSDYYYEASWTARVGQNLRGLEDAGYIVVSPKESTFDLSENTPVELGGSSINENASILANEKVVLAVGDGLAGPFTMRAMAGGQTYIQAVSLEAQAKCRFWKAKKEDVLLAYEVTNKDLVSVAFDVAPVFDTDAFEETTIDLTSDARLLAAALDDIKGNSGIKDIKDLTGDKTALMMTDVARRERVLTLAKNLGSLGAWSDETRRLMVDSTLKLLTRELTAKDKPVTEALISALTDTESLKGLARKLTHEEDELKREHDERITKLKNAYADIEKRYQDEVKTMDATIAGKQKEIDEADAKLTAKKLQWQKDFQSFVEDAKTKIRNERLAAYIDEDLLPTPAAKNSAAGVTGDAPVDFEARARSTAETLHSRAQTGTKLVDALVRAFQDRRAYDRDDVVNLFVSLANNFLTVFSGDPGIGKTSACRIVADVLGLTGHEKDYEGQACWGSNRAWDRYLQVPVERGWTSKRDFLGYYNPLTGQFNASDIRYYQAFKLLDAEKKLGIANPYPFVFLLDEANLSSMEYYWANFMDICGGKSTDRKELVLGDNEVLDIPAHLRFLATVNIDDTTETLSPRLLDRAWIIRLPQNAVDSTAREPEKLTVNWRDLFATFGCRETNLPSVPELDTVFEAFNAAGISVSMRSKTAIARFVAAGTPLFSAGRQTAVDFAVAQKLLPMIRAGGSDAGDRLKRLLGALSGYNRTQEILTSIIERGERNLNFYQFF